VAGRATAIKKALQSPIAFFPKNQIARFVELTPAFLNIILGKMAGWFQPRSESALRSSEPTNVTRFYDQTRK